MFKNKNLFAQTFTDHAPSGPFIVLSEVESTNNYAMAKLHAGLLADQTALMAVTQTHGKGQRGRHWLAGPGLNLTLSVVFQGVTASPFELTASAALACYDFAKVNGAENVSIKWPNDLYIGDRKSAGILVENRYAGSHRLWSVTGIGINLNQTDFGQLSEKAVSLRQATGKQFPLLAAGRMMHRLLVRRYNQLAVIPAGQVVTELNSVLYGLGKEFRIKQGNRTFLTTIRGVNATGELMTHDTMERHFRVGDIEFVDLPHKIV